jgi:hypothetical protein
MPSAPAEGSTTPTVGTTESSLSTQTTAGVYQLWIDCNAMTDGATPDLLEIRVYSKARNADTERLADTHQLIGAQTGAPLFVSKPYVALYSFRVAIVQLQGTARAFPWSLRIV